MFIVVLAAIVAVVLASAAAAAVRTLTVSVDGGGTVSGPGIDCDSSGGPDCSQTYTINPGDPPTTVSLQATPDPGWGFSTWPLCDTPSGASCEETIFATDKTVSASFLDTSPPSVALIHPTPGWYGGILFIAASAEDTETDVDRVAFLVVGSAVATDTDASDGWSASLDTNGREGLTTLTAIAYDLAGNATTSAPVSIMLDNTAPSGELTGPLLFITRGGLTLTANAADDRSGVASVQFEDLPLGAAWTPISIDSNPGDGWSALWNPTVQGSHKLRVVVADAAGNQHVSATRTINVDTIAPQLTTFAGPSGTTTSRSATFTFTASETATFYCRWDDDGTAMPCTSGVTRSNLATRNHTFSVYAQDIA